MIRFLLMDVEGTTTSIRFVHQVLFPYAARRLPDFVKAQRDDPRVIKELDRARRTVEQEEGKAIDRPGAVAYLLKWIAEDRKHPALKNLQGYLWREGYERGDYRGHLYPDVVPAWEKWRSAGKRLGIYSSGSVEAQQLLFRYSEAGDVSGMLSAHFDTAVGHKKEASAYQNIIDQLQLPPEAILFLSDVEAELDAARQAGMATTQIVRESADAGEKHPVAREFSEISL